MMLPCTWAVAHSLRASRWQFALMSGLALTAWDLFLDPQMVNWNLWQWHEPSGYFGIPWQNYMGWFVTGTLITWLIHPRHVPVRPLLVIYAITWFLEAFGLAFFWGLVGPAIVGAIVMGGCVVWGWHTWHQENTMSNLSLEPEAKVRGDYSGKPSSSSSEL